MSTGGAAHWGRGGRRGGQTGAAIAGSCGGMKALGMEMDCEVCGGDPEYCEKSPFVSSPAASQSQDDLAQGVGK